ncbi:sugar phosphate isomerase/epimerase [Candidatus Poribacteria bacterium]|nr:sugar phosphate isomerase/epimerase [Candidatus Poribacteria bacterium]
MKFGVVTHAVGHHLSFEKTLSTIKEIGFDSILLLSNRDGKPVSADGTCESLFPNLLSSDPAHVRLALDNAGLEIRAVHFAGKIDISSDEGVPPTIAALREYASYTLALGCKYLTHHVPSCGRLHTPTKEKATEILRLAKCMNAVAEAFADENLKISVDIHQSAFVEGLDDCRLLVDSMPQKNAGLLLNIGHLTTVQAYGWLLVDEYPDRIPVVGWKDHSLAKDRPQTMWSVELGCGHSPFELYIKAFKRNPEERVHLINCENVPDEERIGALRRSLDYMRRLWDET